MKGSELRLPLPVWKDHFSLLENTRGKMTLRLAPMMSRANPLRNLLQNIALRYLV
jgi:hypothetical protein